MAITIYSFDEFQKLAREGGLPLLAPNVSPVVLADINKTLVVSDGFRFIITAGANRIITLPSAGIVKGDILSFTNFGTFNVILRAVQDVALINNDSADIIALQDIPTTGEHWKVYNDTRKPFVLPDTAVLLNISYGFDLIITPTSTRVLTLPVTGIIAGDLISITNLATAKKITIESSDGDDIATFQNGSMSLVALQATPTDRTHWRIINAVGGASPSFFAWLDANQITTNTPSADVVEFETIVFDTNNSFNVSTHRFVPGVPGKYFLHALITQLTAGSDLDQIEVFIVTTSSVVVSNASVNLSGTDTEQTIQVSGIFEVDDAADYFEVTFGNKDRNVTLAGIQFQTQFIGYRVGN